MQKWQKVDICLIRTLWLKSKIMVKWHKIDRHSADSWVIYSKDEPFRIWIVKVKSAPAFYRVSVINDNFTLFTYSGVDKNRLIAHAKKVLNNFLYPVPNKTKIYPKTKEAKVAKTTKRKIPKRTLKGNALNSRFNKIANKNTKNIKSTNTRFLGTIKEGMYLYIHKKKMRKKK